MLFKCSNFKPGEINESRQMKRVKLIKNTTATQLPWRKIGEGRIPRFRKRVESGCYGQFSSISTIAKKVNIFLYLTKFAKMEKHHFIIIDPMVPTMVDWRDMPTVYGSLTQVICSYMCR